jgi:hypothetical protein
LLSPNVEEETLRRGLENPALEWVGCTKLLDQGGGEPIDRTFPFQGRAERIGHCGTQTSRFGFHHPQSDLRFHTTTGEGTRSEQSGCEDAAHAYRDLRINQLRRTQLQFSQELVQDVPLQNHNAPGRL